MGPYLDYRATAGYLSCSVYALQKMVERGEIPFIKLGNRVRFSKDDIDQYMAARRVSASA